MQQDWGSLAWGCGVQVLEYGEISFVSFVTTRGRSLKEDPGLHKNNSLEDESPKILRHISVAMSWAIG